MATACSLVMGSSQMSFCLMNIDRADGNLTKLSLVSLVQFSPAVAASSIALRYWCHSNNSGVPDHTSFPRHSSFPRRRESST